MTLRKTLQINFGESLQWANPYFYIQDANLGINQIAITPDNQVIASALFAEDMKNRTMTMNPHADLSRRNWEKTVKKAELMIADRAEFIGWTLKETERPTVETGGEFWAQHLVQQANKRRHSIR